MMLLLGFYYEPGLVVECAEGLGWHTHDVSVRKMQSQGCFNLYSQSKSTVLTLPPQPISLLFLTTGFACL